MIHYQSRIPFSSQRLGRSLEAIVFLERTYRDIIEVKAPVHIKTQKIAYYVSVLLAMILQLFLEGGIEKLHLKHRTSRQVGKAAGWAVCKDFLTGQANRALTGADSVPGPVA